MVTHRRAIVPLLLLPLALVAACDKVPLLAPTGTVINLFPVTTTVSLNSEVTIIATVIENGVASGGSGGPSGGGGGARAGNGTPVQNGTVISFTTTIGRIEPSEARTNNGQVNVRLITGNVSGTATITAYSGGASNSLNLAVGTAAVRAIVASATPTTLGSSGGSSIVTATALNEGGSPVGGVPLFFSTDVGTISPSTANTDASGTTTATLTTTATAKVKATVGVGSGTQAAVSSNEVTVTVNAFALASFTVNNSSTTAGGPVTFTVTPTANTRISSLRVEFGDGDSTNLGAPPPAASPVGIPVTHVYNAAGIYTARATAIDASGGSNSLTATVIVGSLQITLTGSPATPKVGDIVTFTVAGIPAGTPIDHFIWAFDDGTPDRRTTGTAIQHSFTSLGRKTVRVDVFGVGGGQIGTATTTVNVVP